MDRARESADQCLEIATRTTARKYLARAWRLQGEIAIARQQWDDAHQILRRALEVAEFIGNPPQLWKTHLALGRVHSGAGNVLPARQAYRAAHDVIERVKANLRNADLRASIEHASTTREVYRLATPEQ
jgi:hypothetical protein